MRRLLFLFLLFLVGCARIDYPAIGLHHSIVTGGQEQINEGNIVDYNGIPGIWLAGHRTSDGAVFHNLVDARIGDRVCAYSHCYHVIRIIDYPSHVYPGYLGPLVLQTSLPVGVLLVVCA